MSRWEFMRQLEDLLSDIPPSEREEALQYYNDYFNDAGRQNEQEVIKALGTPEQVAQIVKDGISGNGDTGEFTENGFSSSAPSGQNELIKRNAGGSYDGKDGSHNDGKENSSDGGTGSGGSGSYNNAGNRGNGSYSDAGSSRNSSYSDAGSSRNSSYSGAGSGEGSFGQAQGGSYGGYTGKTKQKEEMPAWAIALIVIGCIIFSPAILGLLCAALGLAVGVFATVIGLLLGVGITALVLFVVAVSLVIAGFSCLAAYPLTGIGLLGGGLICGALGILFLLLTGVIVMKCIPGICKGIAYIFRKLFGSKGGAR